MNSSMPSSDDMFVIKRSCAREPVSFDKVLERIRRAATGLSVNYTRLAQLVLAEIHDGVHTAELDELAARLAISFMTMHPDWGTLAAQIIVSNCQRSAPATFSEAMAALAALEDSRGRPTPALAADVAAFVAENAAALNEMVQPGRDFLIDYFGFKTLEKAYLLRGRDKQILETPQYMWLRVAVGIWGSSHAGAAIPVELRLTRIRETYDLMSQKAFTHATPTLFNSGTMRPQLSSCFLVAMKDDSIDGIFDTLKECAQISKYAGGIGLHVHNIRAQGTPIAGTQGTSNGLVPMLRVFNNCARYVDQCFLPGTLIYTESGPRAIEDIGVGEKVLTSTGGFETVNRPLRHEYSGAVSKLTIKHSLEPIFVTPEHNVLALTGQAKMLNHTVIANRLTKKLKEVEWVVVKDLQVGDFLAFQIPNYEKDIPSLTEADCRLFGILLGDGHISSSTSGVKMNTTTKAAGIAFVKEYFAQRGVKLYIDEQPNVTGISWSTAATDFKFTHAQLYNSAGEKTIPSTMLHLPRHKILQLLRGIIETDGCVGTKEITLELTSKPLLEQVRYLVLRLGGLTSGYARDRIGSVSPYKNITTRLPSWCIRIPRLPEIAALFPNVPASEYFTFFRHEDTLFSRIESIDEDVYAGVVHDFEIDTTHDYTISHMGIAHNGGGKRNGSFAIYLEPWHADIQAFLKMKSNTGAEEERARDLFYAMWIPDLFMKRVEAGADWSLFCPHEAPGLADAVGPDFEALYTRYEAEGRARRTVPAQKLWSEILVSQIETGTPYLVYKDAANLKSNQKNLGTIKSSNLCVAPETFILTDKGQFPIQELAGQEVNVWNGDTWSKTTVLKTGEQQRLVTVSLSNGAQIHCTPYHKFLVRDGYTDKTSLKDTRRVAAGDLQEGMKLAKCDLGVVEGNPEDNFPHPYTHGFFCGDGTVSGGSKVVALYGEKKNLLPILEVKSTSGQEDAQGRINCVLPKYIPDKFAVPINATLACRLQWFAGLCDADGTVATNGDNESIQIGSINYEFLDRIRLMLQTLGVQSKVAQAFGYRQTLLPDGHDGRRLYDCQPLWRLLISSSGLYRLIGLGFQCHRLTFTTRKPQRNAEQFVTVVSVVDDGRVDDTYCFNEPLNHAGVFNGVLTGNCTEIIEYSSPEETAVCNLASIALPHFLETDATGSKRFNFDRLRAVTTVIVRNLNRVIDINYYPTPETRRSNMRHRPIGLGVQGLADVFAILGLAWETPEAAALNQEIFENIYFAAVHESYCLAAQEGPYETFRGSPASQGLLQPDLWVAGTDMAPTILTAGYLDWDALRQRVMRDGLRNSLLMAPMPTASTSQILGYNECIEPFTTNIYVRRTLAGEFTVVNKYLIADLMAIGLWTPELKERIIAANGSIQGVAEVPTEIKARYKTVWEIKQKTLIDMAADRGAFICQSQSLNLFVADPTIAKLSSMHFYAWKRGLKTGIYYLRTKSAVQAIKFTVDPTVAKASREAGSAGHGSSEPAECLLCSA